MPKIAQEHMIDAHFLLLKTDEPIGVEIVGPKWPCQVCEHGFPNKMELAVVRQELSQKVHEFSSAHARAQNSNTTLGGRSNTTRPSQRQYHTTVSLADNCFGCDEESSTASQRSHGNDLCKRFLKTFSIH